MAKCVDVLIRGAGPAGCVAASWLARAGRTVAIFRRTNIASTDRIEAISPDIVALIGRIGLNKNWLRRVASPIPGTVSRWGGLWEECQDYMMSPHGPAWATHREVFDQALFNYAIAQNRVQVVEEDVEASTTFLAVGAEASPTAREDDKLVALTRNYSYCPDGDRRLRIEAGPHGWMYALRAGDNALGLGFVTDRQTMKNHSPDELWNESFEGPIRELAEAAGGPSPLRATLVRCAFAVDDQCRIGNARVAYDPLTGRGVAEAVRSAIETVSLKGNENLLAQQRLEERYQDYLMERRRLYQLGAARFGTGFWCRRIEL